MCTDVPLQLERVIQCKMISCREKTAYIFLIIWLTILGVNASSYQEEISLTAQEKAALDKFKTLVIPKIPATSYIQNYKKDDLYFIRWVRTSRELDVAAAEKSFLNHLKWREDQRIDSILDEDWSEFETGFPLYSDTVDKSGRPSLEVWFGEWNTRQAALTGKSKQLVRWVAKNFEQTNRRLYSSRAEGKQITQAVSIAEIDGFNLIRHACPACLPVYANIIVMHEAHYKGMLKSIYMMNVPPTFQVVLRLIQAVAPDAVKLVKIFTNREQGLQALDKRFDKEQRSDRFGGTLIRNPVF